MKIYLAGPMRGYDKFNRAAFEYWEAELQRQGHEVYSPSTESLRIFGEKARDGAGGDESKIGGDPDTISRIVFHLDLTYICLRADAVALIPGWEKSKGAFAEMAVARALHKIRIIELHEGIVV